MLAKYIASLSFLAVAVLSFAEGCGNYVYFLFIFLGLLLAHAGDIFLGVKDIAPAYRKRLIPVGLLCFLIAQTFYLTAFMFMTGFNIVPLILACCIAAGAGIIVFVFKFEAPLWLKIAIIVYYFSIAYMTTSACYFYIHSRGTGAMLALIGSLLFIVSDTVLGFIYFKENKFKRALGIIEVSTYFAAQALIALSVMYV